MLAASTDRIKSSDGDTAMRKVCVPAIAVSCMLAVEPAVAGSLVLEISNFDGARGVLYAQLFDSEAAYKANTGSVRQFAQPVNSTTMRLEFNDLPSGQYAARLFQDLNGDRKVNTNFVGMPTEPFGFTNNAPANFGPPSFGSSAVIVGDRPVVQTIKLNR
jgi:uncharacterized protein (DUF2141 family)